jgi:hypothetical protein
MKEDIMIQWRCTVCKRPRERGDALPDLVPSLTAKYRTGQCKKCRAKRYFEPWEPEIYQPPPKGVESAGPRDPALGAKWAQRGMSVAEQSEAMSASGWNERADAVIRALASASSSPVRT